MKWEFGLCTGFYYYPDKSWPECLAHIADLGFVRHVQFYPNPPTDDVARLKKLLHDLGLNPESWHYGDSFDAQDESQIRPRVEWAARGIDTCEEIGIQLLLLHGGLPAHYCARRGPYALLVAAVREVAAYARARGVRVMFENVHPEFGAEKLAQLARDTNPEVVGVCLDTGHANIFGLDPCQEVLAAGEHLWGLHLHDNYGATAEDFFACDRHLAPGEGNVDWRLFMANLEKVDYQGVLMLELSQSEQHRAGAITRETVGKPGAVLSYEARSELLVKGRTMLCSMTSA